MASSRQEELRGRLRELGFDEVRFARLDPPPRDGLTKWFASGYHADMDWMERTAEKRADPQLVLEGARSAIVLGIDYYRGAGERAGAGPRWARYSLYEDYHDTVRKALERAGGLLRDSFGAGPTDYRYYVDTGPILERTWAARSGMGFVGKNAMLISKSRGNWLFLASIITRLDFEPDPPVSARGEPGAVGQLCGKCTRCMDACPTGALPAPGVLDARRCISYQTIENKGKIPAELRPMIGDRVFGCDTCLEVCPWNRFARGGRQMILSARSDIGLMSLRELLELTPQTFAAKFKGTSVKRLKLAGLLRNACIAAGNSGDAGLVEPLLRLAGHESALVRAHAVWAARRLGAGSLLGRLRDAEVDPMVIEEYGPDPVGAR